MHGRKQIWKNTRQKKVLLGQKPQKLANIDKITDFWGFWPNRTFYWRVFFQCCFLPCIPWSFGHHISEFHEFVSIFLDISHFDAKLVPKSHFFYKVKVLSGALLRVKYICLGGGSKDLQVAILEPGRLAFTRAKNKVITPCRLKVIAFPKINSKRGQKRQWFWMVATSMVLTHTVP